MKGNLQVDDEIDGVAIPTASGNALVVGRKKLNELRHEFPLVDVELELQDVARFLEDNPERKVSRSGTPAMYMEWLRMIQNRKKKTICAVASQGV